MRYTHLPNIANPDDVPADGILSRTVYSDDTVKVVLFGFAAGEELSEHTASMPAIIHILLGEAHITLGDDTFEGQAGTWIHMPAHLPHSIQAKTPLAMVLLMLKN